MSSVHFLLIPPSLDIFKPPGVFGPALLRCSDYMSRPPVECFDPCSVKGNVIAALQQSSDVRLVCFELVRGGLTRVLWECHPEFHDKIIVDDVDVLSSQVIVDACWA